MCVCLQRMWNVWMRSWRRPAKSRWSCSWSWMTYSQLRLLYRYTTDYPGNHCSPVLRLTWDFIRAGATRQCNWLCKYVALRNVLVRRIGFGVPVGGSVILWSVCVCVTFWGHPLICSSEDKLLCCYATSMLVLQVIVWPRRRIKNNSEHAGWGRSLCFKLGDKTELKCKWNLMLNGEMLCSLCSIYPC